MLFLILRPNYFYSIYDNFNQVIHDLSMTDFKNKKVTASHSSQMAGLGDMDYMDNHIVYSKMKNPPYLMFSIFFFFENYLILNNFK